MNLRRIFLISLLMLHFLSASLQAQDTARILFIGNSYTFANLGVYNPEIPLRLREMGDLYGKKIITGFSGSGGYELAKHWKLGKAAQMINRKSWDYVVLQEQSFGPIIQPSRFENYLGKFIELIRENNAEPILYMTWARKNRLSMIDTIAAEYIKMGLKYNARIAPCGYAWDIAGSEHPEISLYREDLSHPRPEGVLLNTYIFYLSIFGEIPEDPVYKFSFKEIDISEETAKTLVKLANEAVSELDYGPGRNFN